MTTPVPWNCARGHYNEGGSQCKVADCPEVLSRRRQGWLRSTQALRGHLPNARSFDRTSRVAGLGLVGFAILVLNIVGSIGPGTGGLVYLVADGGDASSPCVGGSCPTIASITPMRVRSTGLLDGPGNIGLDTQVYASVNRNRAGETGLSLRRPGADTTGTVYRSARGSAWVVDLETEPPERSASYGRPTGRSGLTFRDASDVEEVRMGTTGAAVVTSTGPLSQTPAPVVWLLAAGVAWASARRMSRGGLEWGLRLLWAVIAGLVSARATRAPIATGLGNVYSNGDYHQVVGTLIVLGWVTVALAGPVLGLTLAGRWANEAAERYLALGPPQSVGGRRVRQRTPEATAAVRTGRGATGRIGWARAIGALAWLTSVVLLAQLSDQVLGSIFLGWSA